MLQGCDGGGVVCFCFVILPSLLPSLPPSLLPGEEEEEEGRPVFFFEAVLIVVPLVGKEGKRLQLGLEGGREGGRGVRC